MQTEAVGRLVLIFSQYVQKIPPHQPLAISILRNRSRASYKLLFFWNNMPFMDLDRFCRTIQDPEMF